MVLEYDGRIDKYKFNNFIMTYYNSEEKINKVNRSIEIYVDYSKSMKVEYDFSDFKEVK